jgi:hypothetical protein
LLVKRCGEKSEIKVVCRGARGEATPVGVFGLLAKIPEPVVGLLVD